MTTETKPVPSSGAGCLAWFVIFMLVQFVVISIGKIEKLETRVEKLESKDSPKETP